MFTIKYSLESLLTISFSIKPGKVVIVLNGRFAGRKAVVVKNFDEGTKERPYAHALVTGTFYSSFVTYHFKQESKSIHTRSPRIWPETSSSRDLT